MRLNASHNALELWEPLCKAQQPPKDAALLLLPPEYDFLDPTTGPEELWRIATIAAHVRGLSETAIAGFESICRQVFCFDSCTSIPALFRHAGMHR